MLDILSPSCRYFIFLALSLGFNMVRVFFVELCSLCWVFFFSLVTVFVYLSSNDIDKKYIQPSVKTYKYLYITIMTMYCVVTVWWILHIMDKH